MVSERVIGWLTVITSAVLGAVYGWKLSRSEVKRARQETIEFPPVRAVTPLVDPHRRRPA